MAVRAPPVQVVTTTGAPPFVHVPSGASPPFVVTTGPAPPIQIVASGAPPITLYNEDGSIWVGGAAAGVPVNTVLPVITGTTTVGQTLSCSTGTWTGATPITYSYQWARSGAGIGGASSSTYTLVSADTGKTMECEVYAENAVGPTVDNAVAPGVGPVAGLGGAILLDGETDGFATDFTYPTDGYRVARKTAGTVTGFALDGFYTNASTTPKRVYDAAGTLVWSPHNMYMQSENLAATWSLANLTATATQIIPTATPASVHRLVQSGSVVAGATYTFRAVVSYPPGSTYSKLGLAAGSTTNTGMDIAFDINLGTIIYTQIMDAACSATIVPGPGAGQYTITAIVPGLNTTWFYIFILPPTYTTGGVGTAWTATDTTTGINIHRLQLNRGAVPTAYLPTTTAARFGLALDYDPVTHAAKGLLCETTATNLALRSSEFATSPWVTLGTTVVVDAIVAPNGGMEADAIIPNSGSNPAAQVSISAITVAASGTYTFSAYLKNGTLGNQWCALGSTNNAVTYRAWFNLATGVKGTSSGGPTSYNMVSVGNGWYRCDITVPSAATAHYIYVFSTANDGGTFTIVGDGVSPGCYVWGAQLEVGNPGFFPTSYIPTFAASASRTADQYNFTSASINHSATAGSWWIDLAGFVVANGQMMVRYTNGSAYPIGAPSAVGISINDSTSLSKTSWTGNLPHKVASAFQSGDRAITFDGLAVVTDTGQTTNLLAPGTSVFIGNQSGGAGSFQGYVRKVRYVPRRKTNAEMVTETT